MKLEEQVVNLELSEKLRGAGYKQKGLWWWWICYASSSSKYLRRENEVLYTNPWDKEIRFDSSHYSAINEKHIVAPTVPELLERLPYYINGDVLVINREEFRDTWGWFISYGFNGEERLNKVYIDTLANSLAKMYLYLKEEGLIN